MELAASAHLPVSLRQAVGRAERKSQLAALLLVGPLVIFLLVNFVAPVALLLFRSVDNRDAMAALPRTATALAQWNGEGTPDEKAFEALVEDLRHAERAKLVNVVGKRLNAEIPGFQALLGATTRRLAGLQVGPVADQLIALDGRWGEAKYWRPIQELTRHPLTSVHLLGTVDLTIDERGDVVRVPETRRLFGTVWLRTFGIASSITVLCLLLGYPLAYFMTVVSSRWKPIVMLCVLLPFWTSLLVRTVAWIILLQEQGVVNSVAIALGAWHERVQLIHNRFGVYVVMTHILLPFMVLPIYANMRRISPTYLRAALSLGAHPINAFRKIYLPMTLPGMGAGCLFVFILSLGFYITPALVGGRDDQMISYFIAFFANETLNWNAAAALSAVLLALTVVAFALFNRIFKFNLVRVG